MARNIIVLLVCCSAVCLFAQSQPPSPSAAKTTNSDQFQGNKNGQETNEAQQPSTDLSAGHNSAVSAPAQGGHEDKSEKKRDDPSPYGWPFWLTVVIASAAAISACAAVIQARIYIRQAAIMKDSLEVYTDQASQLRLTVQAGTEQSKAMDRHIAETARLVAETAKLAESAKVSADAGTKIADAAVLSAKTADLALKTLEKADVQLVGVKSDIAIAKAGIAFEFTFKNFGRSGAENVQGVFRPGEVKDGIKAIEMTPDYSMISTGAETKLMGEVDAAIAPSEFIEAVKAGREVLLLNVTVVFRDVFDNIGGSHSGAVYQPGSKGFVIVPRGSS